MSEKKQKELRSKLDKRMNEEAYVENLKQQNETADESLKKQQIEENKKRLAEQQGDSKGKKILAIVGTAGSRHLAPYDNPDCEIWGVAHCLLLQDIPRMDKVFEIHLPKVYEIEISPYSKKPIIYHANKENAAPWRKKEDMSVIVLKENENLNKQEVFPRQKLKDMFEHLLPVGDGLYQTNSIAWMIAYAISMDRFDEIHLYGIHLETESEWGYERPCVEMWLGIFTGMQIAKGVKTRVVYVPEMAPIMRGFHEYGFAEIETFRKELQGRVEFFDKSIKDMHRQINGLGAQRAQLLKEIRIPIEDKAKQIRETIEKYKKELEKFDNCDDKIMFEKDMKEAMQKQIEALDKDIRIMENRISAFNGGKEQNVYFLKRLNA